MAASSQCIIISTPVSRAACIVETKPGALASNVRRTMNTLTVDWPASARAASDSAVVRAVVNQARNSPAVGLSSYGCRCR